ncbi:hypothetical protein QBC32DRAFT_311165 [Pseudoneurospora amorphoporcata]|uniref:Zn(2)-C6 fungal-type domain-containing protein n=1 Tax=Pseudoneurospora amorphoporcata TaxID=241081 RepID=A0AAN6P269_9PEZI|nr:hypothetical protein QBC32DRAFT_311165 [Pseudoneurospora amorphoporcata]
MSHYDPVSRTGDMPSANSPDEAQARRDVGTNQNAGRQQLPSLSSLFGPSTTQLRPLHSPTFSDRPGLYTTSSSPLDHPRGPAGSWDRPYSASSSYFPPPSLTSQPRSTPDPRLDERPHFPPPLRALPGPLSPIVRESEPQRPHSQSGFSVENKWSLRHETGQYGLGNRQYASYRSSPTERPHSQLSNSIPSREEGLGLRSEQPAAQPPTPASTGASEVTVGKDGLGPKIWTGTHFLPRFVREEKVDGEKYFIYDDGTRCKDIIDGEKVNAHWGVTKAGKPRKRLAIACITCREKKIKCDPDYPRCAQCEKFGRTCKFKNAPRGGHNTSPSTPPAEVDDARRLSSLIRPPPHEYVRTSAHSSESVSPRTTLRPASPEMTSFVPSKRLRIGYDHYAPAGGHRPPMAPAVDHMMRSNLSWHSQPELPRVHEDAVCRAWQIDPYVSDPESVISTITSFFVSTDATTFRFLPEKAFKTWVQNNAHHENKSPEDLMLVYSILALGSLLSTAGSSGLDPRKEQTHHYAQVARYATKHATISLQLVQARILLSLYYMAVLRPIDANEMSSSAISAAAYLQLNLELDQSPDVGLKSFPYGLTRAGFAECRRRTFWSCFLLERLNGLFPTRMAVTNPADIFLRLPMDIGSFEEQEDVSVPVSAFQNFNYSSFPEPHQKHSETQIVGKGTKVGMMGCLIQVVALWGEVMALIYRIAHCGNRLSEDEVDAMAKFHQRILSRLESWRTSLSPSFLFSAATLDNMQRENKGSLILMHLIYHLAMVKAHRHIHPRFSTSSLQRSEHACIARTNAHQLLGLVCTVANHIRATGNAGPDGTSMPPPFTSFAILEALDVLSAEGHIQDLPGLVDGLAIARSVLEILGMVWEDARAHKTILDHRLDRLVALRERTEGLDDALAVPPVGRGRRSMSEYGFELGGIRVYVANSDDGLDQPYQNERDGKQAAAAGSEGILSWQMGETLEARFPREMDCIYGGLQKTNAPITMAA